jgi:hypothetical protein
MKQERFPFLVALALALGAAAAAQDKGSWQAVSKTAESITGDVSFGNETITIDSATFPLAQIRLLTVAEAAALFAAEPSDRGNGSVYRVSIPAAKKFVRKNTLCGADETEWVVSYVSGHTLQLALFSGQKIPTMSAEALAATTSLCGTFSYAR